ncbi:MAG: tetratricopeptide repeat protein, partial [Burkholderiales bacterium]
MDLNRSQTLAVLGVLGALMGAAGFVTVGPWLGAGAVGVVVCVLVVGLWRERDAGLLELLRFEPAKLGELDALMCGVDSTAPWLLELTDARDGEHLLRFVPTAPARKIARQLADAVGAQRSVVVALLGEAKTGKTRCMFETLRAQLPERTVLIAPLGTPEAARAVAGHRRLRSPGRKRWTVLWLDDLEHYVALTGGRPGVDDQLLDELLTRPRLVIAITAGARHKLARLRDTGTLDRLIPGDDPAGQQIIRVLGPRLAERIGVEGLGAACVGGPALLDIHRSECHPNFDNGKPVAEGLIVVECLIAAAELRLGPLTRGQLLDVYRQTLTGHGSEESFDRALRWAQTPLHGEIALALADEHGYRAYSYIVQNAAPIGEYRQRAERALAATIEIDMLVELADEAKDAYALKRALRLYGLAISRIDDDAQLAAVLGSQGLVQSALGLFDDALASLQCALAIEERVYGPDHHEVAITLGNLGSVQLVLGRLEDALVSQQRALAIEERVYGPDHHEVA